MSIERITPEKVVKPGVWKTGWDNPLHVVVGIGGMSIVSGIALAIYAGERLSQILPIRRKV